MARLTSFLQTTTGLITAVTTLLVAVVGLVTAFSQLRGEDDDPPPASITTVLGRDSAAETELRSYVPAAVRSSCGAPKDAEEGAIAAFNCTYREVVNVQYN